MRSLFDVADSELQVHSSQARQEIAPEDERVDGRQHGVEPAARDEERLAGVDLNTRALRRAADRVREEGRVLLRITDPRLIGLQVLGRGLDEVEDLLTAEDLR